jgi:hypothetical protein
MDYYNDYVNRAEKLTTREWQEKRDIEGKSHAHMVPYRSTIAKGIGEYSASDEDKLKVI